MSADLDLAALVPPAALEPAATEVPVRETAVAPLMARPALPVASRGDGRPSIGPPVAPAVAAIAEARDMAGPRRILLRVSATLTEREAEAALATLGGEAAEGAEVARAAFGVAQSEVRYFHPEDSAEAARLAMAVSGRARDFSAYRPAPAPGTVEIWLAEAE